MFVCATRTRCCATIDCARKETDPEMKKTAVRYLSEMRSKEAMDYLMEILAG